MKTKKRNLKEEPVGKTSPEMLRQSSEEGKTVPDAAVPQPPASSPSRRSGRRRQRRDTRLTSTPVKRSSPDVRTVTEALTGADDTQRITRSKVTFSPLLFFPNSRFQKFPLYSSVSVVDVAFGFSVHQISVAGRTWTDSYFDTREKTEDEQNTGTQEENEPSSQT